MREDSRFKNVGPDILEMTVESENAALEEGFYFDWSFVEFARNNYRTFCHMSIHEGMLNSGVTVSIQRASLLEPGQSGGACVLLYSTFFLLYE